MKADLEEPLLASTGRVSGETSTNPEKEDVFPKEREERSSVGYEKVEGVEVKEARLEVHEAEEAQKTASQKKSTSRTNRLLTLDLTRGFIMVVMAWDHVRDQMGMIDNGIGEVWSGKLPDFNNNLLFFFSRTVSSICAPGFSLTMGMGIALYTSSRLARDISPGVIRTHFLKRALVLFLLGRLVIFVNSLPMSLMIWRGADSVQKRLNLTAPLEHKDIPWFVFQLVTTLHGVITCLAICMIMGAYFLFPMILLRQSERSIARQLGRNFGWITFGLCFLVSNVIITHFQGDDPSEASATKEFPDISYPTQTVWQGILRLFFIPFGSYLSWEFDYPVIPWFGFTALGLQIGLSLKENSSRTIKSFSLISLLLMMSFVFVRCFGGSFGNLRGLPRGDGAEKHISPVIEFLLVSKYPPSLAYALFNLSIDFLLLRIFSWSYFESSENEGTLHSRVKSTMVDLLLVFGQTPMFFYLMHHAMIASVSFVASLFASKEGWKVQEIAFLLFIWLPIVVSLYPVCKRFRSFKQTTPRDSWWRLV